MTLGPIYVKRDDRHLVKGGLFGIMNEMAGDAFSVGSQKAKTTSWKVEYAANGSVLHLYWNGIDVHEEAGGLDVEVTLRLRAGDPLSYWRINVLKNRSTRYDIERIRFPILSFTPIGKAEENFFAMPVGRGRLVKTPLPHRLASADTTIAQALSTAMT